MHHDFETRIFRELEALLHRRDGVPAVSIPGDVFVHALQANLQAGAPVLKHLSKVRREAVVRSGLDGQSDALGV